MFKSIISWIITGLIAIAVFLGNTFGVEVSLPEISTTAPTVTTERVPNREAQTFPIDMDLINDLVDNHGLEVHTYNMTVTFINGISTNRDFTGVRLRDILEAIGADMAAMDSHTTLQALAEDGAVMTYAYSSFMDDKTLIAWMENDEYTTDAPRLCPGSSTGINGARFHKWVTELTLYF
ncbi:MAG: molybdopterin-dependent oxidoreductase [Oscillospiraceae bacterium]|nr:molybdopterin-dependent oxidoreductase [Oscillospiraceae bacterium]